MKYVRRQTEVVDAEVWLGPGTETDHQFVEPYDPPNLKPNETHLKCKKRWVDHGFIEPVHVHGKRTWDDIDVVCPGDYIITQPSYGGIPKFTVVTGHLFESTYQEQPGQKEPLVMSSTAWERMNRMQQNEIIQGLDGVGVLIVPDEMLVEKE